MSGLSEPSLRRLEQLEAKPELESYNRGELRAMVNSACTPEQRDRVRLLLTPASGSAVNEAFSRGAQRARAEGAKRFRK